MRDTMRLFVVVGKAAVIVACGGFALALIGVKAAHTPGREEILGVMEAFLPPGIAAWWIFRELRTFYARRDAQVAAITFATFTPFFLLVGLVLSPISGGYAEMFIGLRFFGLVGAFVGITVITTLLSFIACSLVLWIRRRIVSLGHDSSES